MMDATVTRDLATRSRLGAAGRLQLDVLAQHGGRGKVTALGAGRYTLSVPRSPHSAVRMVDLHNVSSVTLRNLERLGLIRWEGVLHALPGGQDVELTDRGRRVAELAS